MHQAGALRAVQALQEQRAFGAQAFVKRLFDGGAHGFDDLGGRIQAAQGLGDAFAGRGGFGQGSSLVGQRGGGVAAAARAGAFGQQLAGVGQARRQRVVAVGQRVHQPGAQCGVGRQVLARQHQVQRGGRANQTGRALRAARARQQAQVHFGQAQLGAGKRYAIVRGQGHFQPAAQRRAMQRGHHRLGAGFNLIADVGQGGGLGRLAEFADVGAGNEILARAHQQNGAYGGVGLRGLDGVGQVAPHVRA
ncbi:hypothetical protein D3C86_747620 [compost metagenome]